MPLNRHPWSGLRGLPQIAWWIALATFVNRAGSMVLPFLVLYLTRFLDWDPDLAALVLVLYGVCSIITGPIAGRLCDRFGCGRIMVLSLTLTGSILLFFPLADEPRTLFLLTAFLSVFSSAFRPAALVIQTEILPDHMRKRGFALNRLAANAGMAIGPAVGGLLASVYFPAIFILDGVSALLSAFLLARLVWGLKFHRESRTEVPWSPLKNREYRFFLMGIFLVGLGFFQIDSTLPLTMVEGMGLTERDFGLLFTLNTAMILLFEVAINEWTLAWDTRRTLFVGATLVGLGFGLMGVVESLSGVLFTVVIWTLGEMILAPTQAVRVTELAPQDQVGSYMGMMTSCFGLSLAVGPALGIALYTRMGSFLFWPLVFVSCFAGGYLMSRGRS